MIIVGMGMAGLLAAGMLRNDCTQIIESQPDIPNNHSALLRFRSSVVGDTLNIPFKKVKVMKAVYGASPSPVADMLRYSWKTNGSYTLRSPISARGELEERFIAPPDLIQQMYDRVQCKSIEFDTDFDDCWPEYVDMEPLKEKRPGIISTLPMPVLMNILDYPGERPKFRWVGGYNVNAEVPNCDVYATLYVPSKAHRFSRISLTGSRLTMEYHWPHSEMRDIESDMPKEHVQREVEKALEMFGIDYQDGLHWEVKKQTYAKILPVDERARKNFMLWATEQHRIYALGRFATWRPSLLLDDLVNDVRVILDISRNGTYAHRRS